MWQTLQHYKDLSLNRCNLWGKKERGLSGEKGLFLVIFFNIFLLSIFSSQFYSQFPICCSQPAHIGKTGARRRIGRRTSLPSSHLPMPGKIPVLNPISIFVQICTAIKKFKPNLTHFFIADSAQTEYCLTFHSPSDSVQA